MLLENIKTSVSSQTEGSPQDETPPGYSRVCASATAPSLDSEETNLLKGVPVQGCMDHGSLSQGQEYGKRVFRTIQSLILSILYRA